MRILIFGGSGVISEYLPRVALEAGMEVYCYCRGRRDELFDERVHIIHGDCFQREELYSKLKDHSFDTVIDFLSFNQAQLEMKLHALTGRVKQYIFISSASVYSTTSDGRRKLEEDDIGNGLWDYSVHKVECENLLKEFCPCNNIRYTIIRPHITYGNQRVPFQINSFKNSFSIIDRMILGKPIAVAGDGNNYCTITHSEDLCRIMVRLFLNANAYDTEFHITSEEAFTWNQVLDIIGKILGIMPRPVYLPVDYVEKNSLLLKGSMVGDKARNMLFDNSKIKQALGEEHLCTLSFETGIARTCNYMLNTERFYEVDLGWNREIDELIKKAERNAGIVPIDQKTDIEIKINAGIYRYNYLRLEQKYNELDLSFRLLSSLTAGDKALQVIEAYFADKGIQRIAIYGLGDYGGRFYHIIKASSKVSVECLIDRKVKLFDGWQVRDPKDKLPEVDAVIVTPVHGFDEIKAQLSDQYDYNIIALEDII